MSYEQLKPRLVTAGILSGSLLLVLLGAETFCWARLLAPFLIAGAVFIAGAELAALLCLQRGQRALCLTVVALPSFAQAVTLFESGCGTGLSARMLMGSAASWGVLSLFVMLMGLLWGARSDLAGVSSRLGEWLVGFFHVGLGGAAWVSLASIQGSVWWLFWVVLVVACSDTGAYFGGSTLQGPKLAPAISPKKTISGSVVGIIAALVAGDLSGLALGSALSAPSGSAGWSFVQLCALSVAVSLGGQVGDLLKSLLKRNHNVKDTGKILPGHGGMLDRIDGMLAGSLVLLAGLTLFAGAS